jgi:hypothetical protein
MPGTVWEAQVDEMSSVPFSAICQVQAHGTFGCESKEGCFIIFQGTSNGGHRSSNRKTPVNRLVRYAIQWYNMAMRPSTTEELATAI